MNLFDEKNKLLNEISNIDDITILTTIEDVINFNFAKKYSLEPLSKDEIINRALISESDIKNNKMISLDLLEDKTVYITDIFDARRNPDEMMN